MKHIFNILISICFISAPFVSFSQYAGNYTGVPITSEAVPHPTSYVTSGYIATTTAPTCVVNAMSWDNPGQAQVLQGWSYVGAQNVILRNSQHISLVQGSLPNDPNGISTITPFPDLQEKGINIDRLWVGRLPYQGAEALGTLRIDTQYDSLIVDEVWIPEGAVLEIVGPHPLIIRKELHNKGTIKCDENLLIPVTTDFPGHPKGFHALFEQKGTVLGRYKAEVMINERPEFLNWDWMSENFGSGATYLDSIAMLGYDPDWIQAIDDIVQQHLLDNYGDEPWYLYLLQQEDASVGDWKHTMVNPPVKGVRNSGHYRDHERVAIYKDQYPRYAVSTQWPEENSLPTSDVFLQEIADELVGISISKNTLNKYHNIVVRGADPYWNNGLNVTDEGFEDSYTTGEWERVSWILTDTTGRYGTGFNTRFQWNYQTGEPTDWWPPVDLQEIDGYPDLPLPWIDPETGEFDNTSDAVEPEYMARRAFRGWRNDFTGTNWGYAFSAVETELEDIFISFNYCRNEDQLYEFFGPYQSVATNWVNTPAQGVDTTWRVSSRGCSDTIFTAFGLFDMATAFNDDVWWNFNLANSRVGDDLWNNTEMLELDTLVPGYDSIYDHQWYYRDEDFASTLLFDGWDVYLHESPAVGFSSMKQGMICLDIETNGSNGNKMWEHPQKTFFADTAGRWQSDLYGPLFDWDSIMATDDYWGGSIYLEPLISEQIANSGAVNDLEYMNNFYPENARAEPFQLNPNSDWWGAGWVSQDYSVPMPFPTGVWDLMIRYGDTEIIDRYTGYSWMNTLDAYDDPSMTYHPNDYDELLIPNLPPNNSGDHTINYKLPTATDWVYTYAPNGLLYEANTWAECININDTLACIDYFDGNNLAYDEWGISTYQDLSDLISFPYEDYGLDVEFTNYVARRNRHGSVGNPLHGYLDLDAVAAKYFEDYPESNHLEFSWWNDERPTGAYNVTASNVLNSRKNYWRRKYHRYGDDIVNDEVEYFLTLLTDQFLAQNGEGFSDELTQVITSFLQEDYGLVPGSPMWNWLLMAPINPNGYVPFGQYALPGASFFARNSSGAPVTLEINADMGVYDFEFPLSTGNEVYLGSNGPGSDGTGYGGRAANAQPFVNNTPADHSTIIVLDWLNDSTYMPWIFLHHRFMDDATNGSEQIFEDNHNLMPNFPWVFTDSSAVRPSNYVEEYGPHNQEPLYVNIPQPLDSNGAWCFVPTLFQDTGSVWYDASIGQIYTRIGLELFDGNGDITDIIYLDEGDTLWIRHSDPYDWPIKGKMYFTNLYGDIDGDGQVNVSDLLTLFTFFNQCQDEVPEVAYFDANGDGCITTSDFLFVIANFGTTIGNEIGEFSGTLFDTGPERFSAKWQHPDWPTAEIEAAFVGGVFPSIYENGNVSATKELTMYGEEISVYNSNLNIVVQGNNTIQLPTVGGPYLVISDRTIAYYDVTEVPNVVTTTATGPVADADGGLTAVLPSLAAGYGTGSAQFWTDFYSDMKTIDYAFDGDFNDAPTLAQIYYGINSGISANPLNLQNAKIEGLIDIFGAGNTGKGYTYDASIGVQNDERFNKVATAYTTFKTNRNDPLFEPTMVPMAFALPRVKTSAHPDRTMMAFETQTELDRKINDGIVENFDIFSELSGKREPGVTEWGGDIKEYYDVELHNGVMVMCDFMTLKDYFEFKMYGVSPKFGQTNTGSLSPRSTTESFGTVYNTGAVEGVPNGPGIGFSPSLCNNLNDYSNNIVVPFLTANIGNVVQLPVDPTPVAQDGIQRNIDNAGHYNWFGNSAAFVHNSSFGPLVYDFNMSGTWDAEDLSIWNNLVAVWTASGIRQGEHSYADASYYRPVTDALNEVVNVLQDYEDGGSYQASWKFNAWFDATVTENPLSYVNNWYSCLNQPEWNLNLINPTILTVDAFGGTATQEDYFFYNGTRTGFNPDFLAPTTLNNYGKVAIEDYVPAADLYEYQFVPSNNYFPVSKYWQP